MFLVDNPKARVIDFYANVDIELPFDCTTEQLQKAEELNLLVRNTTPKLQNYSEKMLRTKQNQFVFKRGKFTNIKLHQKLMSGTEPLKNYWVHSAMLNTAILDGWTHV